MGYMYFSASLSARFFRTGALTGGAFVPQLLVKIVGILMEPEGFATDFFKNSEKRTRSKSGRPDGRLGDQAYAALGGRFRQLGKILGPDFILGRTALQHCGMPRC
jgi:hypothetical protein